MPEPKINDTVFVEGSPFKILSFSEDYGTYLSNLQWVCASRFLFVMDSVWVYEAPKSGKDPLAEWLFNRFSKSQLFEDRDWDKLPDDDKSYWEHEANAVRRAVARDGFKESE